MHKKIRITDVGVRAIVLVALFAIFTIINPKTAGILNIFSLINNSIFVGTMAMGLLIIAVTGQIDLSMTAIALCGGYGTTLLYKSLGSPGNMFWMFVIGGIIGLICGLINGFFVYKFKIPGIVVSIATQAIFYSILFEVFKAGVIADMPANMIKLNKTGILEYREGDGPLAKMNITVILLVIVIIFVWILLNKTMVGRGIYAIGGDLTAAERVGFNLPVVYAVAYGAFGAICGMIGVVHYSFNMIADPLSIVGREMNVIAAVILGGCNLSSGKGTVAGTLIGVAIISLIDSSLVLLKIPSYAQQVVIGIIILISISITSLYELKKEKGKGELV